MSKDKLQREYTKYVEREKNFESYLLIKYGVVITDDPCIIIANTDDAIPALRKTAIESLLKKHSITKREAQDIKENIKELHKHLDKKEMHHAKLCNDLLKSHHSDDKY